MVRLLLALLGLAAVSAPAPPARAEDRAPASAPRTAEIDIGGHSSAELRRAMVRHQLAARGITDQQVLAAMRAVPRHAFVPAAWRDQAYEDHPLPIGLNQTISQPYIVAYMTQLARVRPDMRVLEVGTGSGYQAAVLAEIGATVYTIEILAPLAERAEKSLADLGYDTVHVRTGDGYKGWPEHAPFDAIIVTAAPDHIPQPLVDQLAPGARLILPVGDAYQWMTVVEKREDGTIETQRELPVRFVPMTGEAERR